MKNIDRKDPLWAQAFCAAITGYASRESMGGHMNTMDLVNRAMGVADYAMVRIPQVEAQEQNEARMRSAPIES